VCNYIGVGVIAGTVIAPFVMQWKRKLTVGTMLALGGIGICSGLAIPNLTVVRRFEMTAQGINADMMRDSVNTVTAKTDEVRRIERGVESIARQVEAANREVSASKSQIAHLTQAARETSGQVADAERRTTTALTKAKAVETHVTQMQRDMRQTWRSLLESYVLAMGTRNLFPPPPNVNAEIDKHLNILAAFAYPDAVERDREVKRIMGIVAAAQKAD
jgi:hypothetical protein